MNVVFRAVAVLVLVSLAAAQCGCLLVAAAAGTGATVAYVKGDLESTIEASPKQIAEATRAAMTALEMHVISGESSSVDAKVVGRTAADRKLTVVAKAGSGGSSTISIRAGTFGDDAIQARLLEEICRRLGVSATPLATQAGVSGAGK